MSIPDRLLKPFEVLVRQFTARFHWHALYTATVVAQNADGTLELHPDSDALPELSQVPIRYGIPGATALVNAGTQVLVGFENGDAKRPVVRAFLQAPGSLAVLTLDGGAANSPQPVARKTDPVGCGSLVITCAGATGAGTIVFTYTPPGGTPQVTTVTITAAGLTTAGGGTSSLTGTITDGAPQVKA